MERITNGYGFTLAGARLTALPSGALWWAERAVLVVSDLHLGKSERMARRGGAFLPPYETRETLTRLSTDIDALRPETVISLGDSFDDTAAAQSLDGADVMLLGRLMAGRRWIWVEGNHDPGPLPYGGEQVAELVLDGLVFRHIAEGRATGEVSGHYHPKTSVRGVSRPCFLVDGHRAILPAFGAYTGGLHAHAPVLDGLMRQGALAVLTGRKAVPVPMPRMRQAG